MADADCTCAVACEKTQEECQQNAQWYLFVATSMVILFGGGFLIFCMQILYDKWNQFSFDRLEISRRMFPNHYDRDKLDEVELHNKLRHYIVNEVISLQTNKGMVLAILYFLFNVISVTLYINQSDQPLEQCVQVLDTCNWTLYADIGLNVFFLFHFLLRLIAAPNRLKFWFQMGSIVDFCTIPPCALALILERNWLGMRFMRALRFMQMGEILMTFNSTGTEEDQRAEKRKSIVQLLVLMLDFVSVWLFAAGFVHLVENSGDPWKPNSARTDNFTYFDSVWLTMVTMSTVGYGDVYPTTGIGRSFMMVFIVCGLAMFATYTPYLYEFYRSRSPYAGRYERADSKKYVVVCGHITYNNVKSFLADFLHPDRGDRTSRVLFLDNKRPEPELTGLIKRYFLSVQYFEGSALNHNDLRRVQLEHSDAVILLCNKDSDDTKSEDAATILRAISVKNYCSKARLIMQLLNYKSKSFLQTIPNWDPINYRDENICISEFMYGLVAQSCLCPGFSTLMINLISTRSYIPGNEKTNENLDWKSDYAYGCDHEIYTVMISSDFNGMTFPEAAEICYKQLNLLMIAVENFDNSGLAINPLPDQFTIRKECLGYFIASSYKDVCRARFYCALCLNEGIEIGFKPCKCRLEAAVPQLSTVPAAKKKRSNVQLIPLSEHKSPNNNETGLTRVGSVDSKSSTATDINQLRTVRHLFSQHSTKSTSVDRGTLTGAGMSSTFDPTGNYHWSPEKKFEDVDLAGYITKEYQYKPDDAEAINQRVVIKYINEKDHELNNHIVICAFGDDKTPISGLSSLIKPLRASNLPYKKLKVVLLLAEKDFLLKAWKELRHFPKIRVLCGSALDRSKLKRAFINRASMVVILSNYGKRMAYKDPFLLDKEPILACLNLPQVAGKSENSKPVEFIAELVNDSNVHFLDQDNEDEPDIELHLTMKFAQGSCITATALDTLMSEAYYNDEVMTLVRALIAGANVPEYDAEDEEHSGPLQVPANALCGSQCRVIRIKAEEPSLSEHIKGKAYKDVFVELLQKFNLLCLGLHRAIDWHEEISVEHKRFVYINPPGETKIVASDYLYVIVQTSKLQPPTEVMLNKIRDTMLRKGSTPEQPDSKLTRQNKVDTESVRLESLSMRSVSSVAPSPRTPLSPNSPPAGEERFYNPLHANHTSKSHHILENFHNSYASYSDGH
ncbi:calcium-activated potassium channel subunit alpha-1-like isoform X7 [Bolinopsis microptera]|uniref:calcium-activated potassium channel subunit alpha-1-like isoform X7 n=1 Tax=Bolinopsis microptera TaxID=2820187 RepID=UPI00307A5FF8